jgi:predicted nucleotidyltransferase component of viral defense system
MISGKTKNLAASVRARLLNIARRIDKPFEELLVLYGLERFLFRLSKSIHKDNFVLKGGLLLIGMGVPQARPTKDIDFLGLISSNIEVVSKTIQDIGNMAVGDGMVYDFSKLTNEPMSPNSDYPGIRFKFSGRLGQIRIPMQVDIGFGDRIIPEAQEMSFPTLLDIEPPVIRGYAVETIIAEKFEAALDLADLNSRMKDFYDIWILCQKYRFEGQSLQEAIIATCKRRKTSISSKAQIFSREFANRFNKQIQWAAFLRKGPMGDVPEEFSIIMEGIRDFLLPLTLETENENSFELEWPPGGPWHE